MEKLSLELLEFNKLLGVMAGLAHCDASRRTVLGLAPLKKRADILSRQGLISELMRMSQEGQPLGLAEFSDVRGLVMKARPAGSVLDGIELAAFIPVLEISHDISTQLAGREDLPGLWELVSDLTGFPDILRTLRRSLDPEGKILDSASALLADLRERINRLEMRIRKRLEEMVRDESVASFLQDTFITKRSGRWVVPVRMDSKGMVAGVVHDVSKSGETAFMEPLAIIGLANELENLVADQKAEEIRILRSITQRIRESADGIEAEFETLVHVDMLYSIARFSLSLGMETPGINETGLINLVKARHPLLVLAFQKTAGARPVVPLDLRLGGEDTVMVITGSNAGGKTVAIKTIGLLLLMALSGMPVPASSASSFPLVGTLLADIGDEQSIESSLSTFAAHVSNIAKILKAAGPESLVLLDELGTGTDPGEGAALACAVLRALRLSGALVFATTHLSDIKGFVHMTEGMQNASMEFDQATLTPLYRLRVGEPGLSHGLEIAGRYGLPEEIIDSAKALLGGMKVEFDNLIADLNRKRLEYETALADIARQRLELEERAREIGAGVEESEERARELLSSACREAADIVTDAKRQMTSLLEEMKKQDKTRLREAVRQAEDKRRKIEEKLLKFEKEEPALSIDEIHEGDVVFVKSVGYDGKVTKVLRKQKRLSVEAGGKEIEIALDGVRPVKGKAVEIQTTEKQAPEEFVPSELNLVGLRVDDALSRLEPFLNHASLAGYPSVRIIHGVGAGILSRAVREHLTGHPLVKAFRKGESAEGGAGVTVVTLL